MEALRFENLIHTLLDKYALDRVYNTMSAKYNQFCSSCVNDVLSAEDKLKMQDFLVSLLHVVNYLNQDDDVLTLKIEEALQVLEKGNLTISNIDKVLFDLEEALV